MAAVRIDGVAFTDPRIELLGAIAGYNRYEALGRMAHLWGACTDRETAVLPDEFISGTLGVNGVDALLKSGLGERVSSGCRVKGCEGRIEWLAGRRKASKAGGKATQSKFDAHGRPNEGQEGAKVAENDSQEGAKVGPNDSPLPLPLSLSLSLSNSSSSGELVDDLPTKPIKKFSVPTVDEVAAYCRERENKIDAQRFVDHYTSNGWKVGKSAMKDWRAAVRTWEANNFQSSVGKPSPVQETADSLSKLIAKHGES